MAKKTQKQQEPATQPYEQDLRDALTAAKDSREALVKMFAVLKTKGPQYSLRWIALKAKIPSSGYLSEVFSGKRLLADKHRKGLMSAFQLKGEEQKYFGLLLERDTTDNLNQKEELTSQIESVRKSLRLKGFHEDHSVDGLFFAVEVFCALSMFGSEIKESQLIDFYGVKRRSAVLDALKTLKEFGLLEQISAGTYRTVRPLAHFVAGRDSTFFKQIMKSALFDCLQKLEHWFHEPTKAIFSTSVISVDMDEYKNALPDLKRKVLNLVSELERSPANAVVRLNVQMFPVAERPGTSEAQL